MLAEADGKLGNEEGAPYDCIHVGAAAAGSLHCHFQLLCIQFAVRSGISEVQKTNVKCSDGDAELPAALVEQLRPGGRMVIPVGTNNQVLQTRSPI